ncbi:MAG TPA: hypothetical protein DHV36_02040 [Desulfobacteraceae bacterium]|nr:hypothetical protein [Desulfobacteraceae bacterium]
MNDQKYNLIFTGEIIEGKIPEEVYEKIAALFKVDIAFVRAKFGKGRSVLKTNVPQEMAEKMLSALKEAGASCILEAIPKTVPAPAAGMTAPEAPASPRAKMEPPEPAPAPQENPYAAPKADLRTPDPAGGTGFTDPIKVPASRGAAWVFRTFELVRESPLNWFLTMLLYFIVNLVQIIPIIGPLLVWLLGPAFTAGLVQGVKELDEGEGLRITSLFYGFKTNFGRLLGFALVFLVMVLLALGIVFGIMAAVFGLNLTMFTNPQAMTGSTAVIFALFPLAAMLLMIPIFMLYWFTPALILINDQSIFPAMKLSFSGCLKNWLAFLVNGLVLMGLGIAVAVAMGGAAWLMNSLIGEAGSVIALAAITILIMFFLMPVVICVMYASYSEIFYE